MCCGGVCIAMSSGGGVFTPGGAYDSVWNSVKPMTGKYFINYFQYQEVVGCVCMLNYWFSSNDVFAQTTTTTLELMKGKYTFNYLQYQGVWCVAMSCGGENFSPDGAYDSALDSVMPMKGNTPSITSSTLVDVGCVCMLNDWFSFYDGICADNHN